MSVGGSFLDTGYGEGIEGVFDYVLNIGIFMNGYESGSAIG